MCLCFDFLCVVESRENNILFGCVELEDVILHSTTRDQRGFAVVQADSGKSVDITQVRIGEIKLLVLG